MKPFIAIFLFFVLFLLQFSTHGHEQNTNSDIITNMCNSYFSRDRKLNLNVYNVCVDSLNSVPESHKSDIKGLGVIAIDIAIKEAIKIKSKVGHMINKHRRFMGFLGFDPMYSGLEYCLMLYSDSHSLLSASAKEFKDGNYGGASDYLREAIINTPSGCQAGFLQADIDSPLTKTNREFIDHVAVAMAITDMLQWHKHQRFS